MLYRRVSSLVLLFNNFRFDILRYIVILYLICDYQGIQVMLRFISGFADKICNLKLLHSLWYNHS